MRTSLKSNTPPLHSPPPSILLLKPNIVSLCRWIWRRKSTFSQIRDGRVASQKSDRLDIGHGSQNGYFAPKKVGRMGQMGRVGWMEAWKCPPKPRDQLDDRASGDDHERAVGRGHEAENRILKRSIIQFSAAMSSCSNGRLRCTVRIVDDI